MLQFSFISAILLAESGFFSTPKNGGLRRRAVESQPSSANHPSDENHPTRQLFTFEELDIKDEREAQAFCSNMLNRMELIPDFIDCSCHVKWAVNIIFECQASLCVSDLLDSVQNLNMTNATMVESLTEGVTELVDPNACIVPSYKAKIFAPLLGLQSEVCNQPLDLNVHMPDQEESYSLSLPEVCATVKHNGLTDILGVKQCGFRVGGFECSCDVCEEGGISLDCSQSTELGDLAPMMKFDCVGMDILGLDEAGIPTETFINPALLLGTPMLEDKIHRSRTRRR